MKKGPEGNDSGEPLCVKQAIEVAKRTDRKKEFLNLLRHPVHSLGVRLRYHPRLKLSMTFAIPVLMTVGGIAGDVFYTQPQMGHLKLISSLQCQPSAEEVQHAEGVMAANHYSFYDEDYPNRSRAYKQGVTQGNPALGEALDTITRLNGCKSIVAAEVDRQFGQQEGIERWTAIIGAGAIIVGVALSTGRRRET